MTRLLRIALMCAVCAGLVALNASAADPVRQFKGTESCGAMKVEVSFGFDFAARQIVDFYAEHRCQKGGHAMAVVAAKIDVKPDGTFSGKDDNGVTIEGRIDGNSASGKFSPINTSLLCADQQFHEPCRGWKASAD